nr:hypothetical protein [uncultured Campylobacter sp.]
MKLRGRKNFSAFACSDTARGKNSNEPIAACDLGLNSNFLNPEAEPLRLNLTPRDGKILTFATVKISSAAATAAEPLRAKF